MDAVLAGLNFGVITPMAMLLIAVWLVLTGRIVPRQTMQDALDAARTAEQARAELSGQVNDLLEQAKTTNQLLQSITSKAGAEGG